MKKKIINLLVYLIDLHQKNKQEKVADLKQYKGDFQKSLNRLVFEEENFSALTGIKTNYSMIPKYIYLKHELGENFRWKKVCKANSYLKYSEGKWEVEIPIWNRIVCEGVLMIGLGCFISGVVLITYSNSIGGANDREYLIFPIFQLLTVSILSMFYTESYIVAKLIEKQLTKVTLRS